MPTPIGPSRTRSITTCGRTGRCPGCQENLVERLAEPERSSCSPRCPPDSRQGSAATGCSPEAPDGRSLSGSDGRPRCCRLLPSATSRRSTTKRCVYVVTSTRAPSRANARAIASPIPRAALAGIGLATYLVAGTKIAKRGELARVTHSVRRIGQGGGPLRRETAVVVRRTV